MPVTFAQAAVNTLNDVDFSVIDNLRRYSWLMDHMVWDDCVNPAGGGSTLTYGYTRLTNAVGADFRALNQEYVPGQAGRARFTVDLKPFGGAFTIDRVLANLGPAATNEISFQMQQLMIGTKIRFQQELILGDSAVNSNGFDGLSKALTGTSTEKTAGYTTSGSPGPTADWTAATVDTQAEAMSRLDELDDWLSLLVPSHTGSGDQGEPGALPPGQKAIIGNTKVIARLRALARWAAMYTAEKDTVGGKVGMYGDWALIDIGDRFDGSSPIIPNTVVAGPKTVTDLYAVTFGLDSFHGVSVSGSPLLRTWLPDFTIAGAVKSGEVEMGPIAAVLKNTKSAAVLRSIQVG
jgi:hypothetical protein